jgi:hypothetical protein
MDISSLIVIALAVAFLALITLLRTYTRDRGDGTEEVELKPPGEPGNRGDTDMTGWRW